MVMINLKCQIIILSIPIEVTLVGMVMFLKDVHPLKQVLPMDVTVVGKVTEDNDEHD